MCHPGFLGLDSFQSGETEDMIEQTACSSVPSLRIRAEDAQSGVSGSQSGVPCSRSQRAAAAAAAGACQQPTLGRHSRPERRGAVSSPDSGDWCVCVCVPG